MQYTTWQKIFRFKGFYNCLTTIALLFIDDVIRNWLNAPLGDPVYRTMFLSLAFSFGMGYLTVSHDLTKNHEVIRMGIFGQLSVFVVTTWAVFFSSQNIPLLYMAPAIIDLIFAFLFFIFILKYPGTILNK